ncbi:MAG: hypothetical protein JWP87_3526 [Labilithrix sp.]|nr:hypothetical protein [Labilithrix sp.]
MSTQLASRVRAALGVLVVAPLLALGGCAGVESSRGASVDFAVGSASASAPASIRVVRFRILTHRVNLQEPVILGTLAGPEGTPGEVTITVALRGHEGVTFAVDPVSLDARTAKLYAYPPREAPTSAPAVAPAESRVSLEGGLSLACWTDQESGRVLAQVHDADGSARGAPVSVDVPGMAGFGAPRAMSSDGRHVVVTFFASDEVGFALVAASLEAVR